MRTTTGIYIAQLLIGLVNIILLAPVTMQLAHLLLADAVWISAVLLTAAAPAEKAAADDDSLLHRSTRTPAVAHP